MGQMRYLVWRALKNALCIKLRASSHQGIVYVVPSDY